MTSKDAIKRLRVAGARASGPGYPNAEATISLLRGSGLVAVEDLGTVLPPGLHLWRLGKSGLLTKLLLILRLGFVNACSLVRLICDRRPPCPTYVPYPSIFFLWLVSWLPPKLRPICVADAYISIWDSMFNDRADGPHGYLSKLVRAVERRALQAAAFVMVDTEESRRFFVEAFSLPAERVVSVPLAIDVSVLVRLRCRPSPSQRTRVLFFGTMIPLHGVHRVLDAARLLSHREDIEFRLVGDGQEASEVGERLVLEPDLNFSWHRGWLSYEELMEEIANAEICLGVFGGPGKASRVLPFKVYYALAAGKAVITQEMYSLPVGTPPLPVVTIAGNSAAAVARHLADEISSLATDLVRRETYASLAGEYFDRHLSEEALLGHWRDILNATGVEARLADR